MSVIKIGDIKLITAPVVERDLKFARSSYIMSGQSQPETRCIPLNIYKPARSARFNELLKNSKSMAIYYIDSDDIPELIGYIFWHNDILDYIYIKSAFRRRGIAKAVLVSVGFDLDMPTIKCTHYNYFTIKQFPEYIMKRIIKVLPYG